MIRHVNYSSNQAARRPWRQRRQMAREEGISEPTLRKYRDMDDFSPQGQAQEEARFEA